MLRQRLLTAIVLVPLVVAGVLLADSAVLAPVFGAIVLLGAHEMARLGGLRGRRRLLPPLVLAALLLLWWFGRLPVAPASLWWSAAAFWTFATFALLVWRRPVRVHEEVRPEVLVLGVLQLWVAWAAVMALHRQGGALLLFLLVLIWVADSGAYFAGRAFGRHRLSPLISPGKTWEGALGGLVGALACALAFDALELAPLPLPGLVALCLFTALISIGGDLWESLLKRQAGLKDSGRLLPGHGGVLDRIDSLIAAAPVFVLGLGLLERAA